MKKKLFLEINEITPSFIASHNYLDLPLIKSLFLNNSITHRSLETISEGSSEGYDLDPWVEWPTIHSGLRFSQHKIRSLGSKHASALNYVWDSWNHRRLTCSVWNVFNAYCNPKLRMLKVFLPDPWTKISTKPYGLGIILWPIFKLASSYSSKFRFVYLLLSLLSSIIFLPLFLWKLPFLYRIYLVGSRFRFRFSDFYILYEYFLSLLGAITTFLSGSQRIILCTNIVAHAQHHFWGLKDYQTSSELSLLLAENLLSTINRLFSKYHIYFLNGFNQQNVIASNEFDYLPINGHKVMLSHFLIFPLSIKEGMTHDAIITFSTTRKADIAFKCLSSLQVDHTRLFNVYRTNNCTLEYYLNYRANDDEFIIDPFNIKFSDLFYCLGQRTGSHTPKGVLLVPHGDSTFSSNLKSVATHDLFQLFS